MLARSPEVQGVVLCHRMFVACWRAHESDARNGLQVVDERATTEQTKEGPVVLMYLSDDLAVKVRRRPASCDARQEGKLAEPQPALGHS